MSREFQIRRDFVNETGQGEYQSRRIFINETADTTARSLISRIIQKLLIELGLGYQVSSSPVSWTIYISFLPNIPSEAIVIYDIDGVQDGRIMQGEQIEHPSVQIVVRSPIYLDGWRKGNDIVETFDSQYRSEIELDSVNYIVQSISRQGTMVPVGIDENDGKRRHYFTINAAVTYGPAT